MADPHWAGDAGDGFVTLSLPKRTQGEPGKRVIATNGDRGGITVGKAVKG